MTSRDHPTATITTPNSTPGQSGRFGSESVAAFVGMPGHRQDRMTQKTLSAFRSDGRGLFRFRTATCCRRARISVWSAARSAKISMILCMPERVSGGDAKFQGFCDRWNKWEGQAQQPPCPPQKGFRSTPPREGRPDSTDQPNTDYTVSIHAPTRGATVISRFRRHSATVSIHAPTRGATVTTHYTQILVIVSIHAPTRGATVISRFRRHSATVSIHAPTRGATVTTHYTQILVIVSIHAPTRGATGAVYPSQARVAVSIHAPTRGATPLS